MINRRKLLVSLGVSAFMAPFGAFAQQARIHRFGNLHYFSRSAFVDSGRYGALIQGMRDLGYAEGKTFVLEDRFADGKADLLDGFAVELVRLKVDLILSTGTPAHLAAQRATRTIPIVVIADADPVGNGLAASLARPGGNITGMSTVAAELAPKLVELLTTALPKLSRIAVLANPGNRAHPPAPPRRDFRRQDPQGREAGRAAVRAAHKVLSRDKPQDRQCAWRQDSAGIADAHGQGDRVT